MLDLEERLRVTAGRATDGLDVHDPSLDVVQLAPHNPPRRRRRQRALRSGAAVTAAAAAVLGVVVWSGTDDTRTVPAVADASAADAPTEPSLADATTPAERLHAAFDATLSSQSYQVSVLATILNGGPIQGGGALRWELPSGTAADAETAVDELITVDGELTSISWVQQGVERRASVYDGATGQTFWQMTDSEWQTATIEDATPLSVQLEALGSRSCVIQPDPDVTVFRVYSASDTCPSDTAGWTGGPGFWDVELGPDGRLSEIRPVPNGLPGMDMRSVLRFESYDAAPSLELPPESQVTAVVPPYAIGVDVETGFALPSYTRG